MDNWGNWPTPRSHLYFLSFPGDPWIHVRSLDARISQTEAGLGERAPGVIVTLVFWETNMEITQKTEVKEQGIDASSKGV